MVQRMFRGLGWVCVALGVCVPLAGVARSMRGWPVPWWEFVALVGVGALVALVGLALALPNSGLRFVVVALMTWGLFLSGFGVVALLMPADVLVARGRGPRTIAAAQIRGGLLLGLGAVLLAAAVVTARWARRTGSEQAISSVEPDRDESLSGTDRGGRLVDRPGAVRRVQDLEFVHPAALYRGDGSGVTVIRRARPMLAGSSWARVVESTEPRMVASYLYLERRSGGDVNGRLIVEDEVAPVAGDADATPPRQIHTDPRFTSRLGNYGEVEDIGFAYRADSEGLAALRVARERIAANSFDVTATMEGRSWRARVGPEVHGRTTIVCHAPDGEVRHLDTRAERRLVELARRQAVHLDATYHKHRRFGRPRRVKIAVILVPRPG